MVKHIPFGHTPKTLPNVLGSEEVARLIACVRVPKHRAVLITLYAAGLRLTEATNLKIQDVDSARMQLKVVLGKGRKDRYVPISPKLLKELRDCRTKSLGSHVYHCDRNCPQCAGARRAIWLDKTAGLLLPDIPYFPYVPLCIYSQTNSLMASGVRHALTPRHASPHRAVQFLEANCDGSPDWP